MQEREKNKTLKVHEKLTHNQKLIEGMKAGLKPDISDDDIGDDDDVIQLFLKNKYYKNCNDLYVDLLI